MKSDVPTEELNKVGGISALVAAGTYIFGFAFFATVLSEYATGDPSPGESVAFLVDHQAELYVWNLVILIGFGVALVPLVLAVHERLQPKQPTLARAASVFGVIWAGLVLAAGMIGNVGLGVVSHLHGTDPASAEPVWSALDAVQNGLGGGNELVGGLWIVLVSVAALRSGSLPRWLSYLGVAAGAAGTVTIVPALEDVGAAFGLGLIVWFLGTGTVLLRAAHRPVTIEPARAGVSAATSDR